MLALGNDVRVYFCLQPTDMRLSFCGLTGLVRSYMGKDPLDGAVFVFRNRRGDKLKLLSWDRDGYVIWYKELQRGTFKFPLAPSGKSVEIDTATLRLILDGIDLKSVRRQKRYHRAERQSLARAL